jgi:hypothetical protein
MIQYGRSRAETGYARNAGPGGAARSYLPLETKRRVGGETVPADPACIGTWWPKVWDEMKYVDIAPGKLRPLKQRAAALDRSWFRHPFHTVQQCQEHNNATGWLKYDWA